MTAVWVVLGAVLAAAAVVLVALAALKELEFDHRTGKIGDDDYRETLAPLRQEAAAALRALDRYGPAAAGDPPQE